MGTVRSVLSSLILIAGISLVAAQAPQDPTALATKVQQRYNAIKDFSGDFVQTYEGGVLRTKTTERGTVAIKRPGRMRFTYTKPEKKEFVSDGSRLYTHRAKQGVVLPGFNRPVGC